ncbi:MAG TPA: alpha/beta hydrolase [Dehalococcoidia bacterium]|nr:alpha/beta hydrolase [Dehalococcoidia bacterium]
MPSQQLQTILQVIRSRPARTDMTFQESRQAFEQMASFFAPPNDVRSEPIDAAGVPGHWVSTPQSADDRVIYYLHGGGYVIGSVNTHRSLISRLCRAAKARAFAIDYRLAPEHPFPAAVEDAAAAYRWLLSTGVDPSRTVIAGDSAGGGLTVATLLALRDAGDRLPAAAVCVSPWTDMEVRGESMISRAEVDPMIQREEALKGAAAYLAGADPRHPLASPIHADLAGLPPLLIHVGTAETLLDDSTRLAERARAAGVDVTLEPWDDMFHVWHFFASMLPEGQQAIDRIGEFARRHVP